MSGPVPLLPDATIGILGNGQLGRMLALSARAMGYRVAVFGPGDDTPAAQVADHVFPASYADKAALTAFARAVGVVTFEFENVPADAITTVSQFAPVHPSGAVLHTTQDRVREKKFLRSIGCATAPFAGIDSNEDIPAAIAATGLPGVLKTSTLGYDGRGQRTVRTEQDVRDAWAALGGVPCILEGLVDFAWEGSVVAARGQSGEHVDYGLVRNYHSRHILDVTLAPAPDLPIALADEASRIVRAILKALNVVGVLCVEFFVTGGGKLLVNELAPRPHNSGHWTIEGAETSQFEQQLRAVCGLPLGSPALRSGGAALANLLGDLWQNGEPNWSAALAIPGVHLHLYGKSDPQAGRKMGHLSALGSSPEDAGIRVRAARERLIETLASPTQKRVE